MSRHSIILTLTATALLAAPARAVTPPQTGSGGASSVRCATCGTREDRLAREKLLLQIESLRWRIENKRMTDEERRRTVSELTSTIRALQQSLDESARGVAVAPVAVEAATAPNVAGARGTAIARIPMRARGYLGVTFDGPSAEISRPGDYSVRFYKYPRIALVEPSSPAERAGVLQGDTLMSFNGTDVIQHEISLSKLLVPDARIVMRVRRDGNNRDLKVTVGEAPDYYVRRRETPSGAVRVWAGGIAGAPEQPVRVMPAPQATEPAQAPVILWQEYDGVAGARVETVSEGLGKALGVAQGVLVVRVGPGTPAYRAGLRDGDVIVQAGGRSIRMVTEFRSVIARGDREAGVTLLIKREGKEKDVTLRW